MSIDTTTDERLDQYLAAAPAEPGEPYIFQPPHAKPAPAPVDPDTQAVANYAPPLALVTVPVFGPGEEPETRLRGYAMAVTMRLDRVLRSIETHVGVESVPRLQTRIEYARYVVGWDLCHTDYPAIGSASGMPVRQRRAVNLRELFHPASLSATLQTNLRQGLPLGPDALSQMWRHGHRREVARLAARAVTLMWQLYGQLMMTGRARRPGGAGELRVTRQQVNPWLSPREGGE